MQWYSVCVDYHVTCKLKFIGGNVNEENCNVSIACHYINPGSHITPTYKNSCFIAYINSTYYIRYR